LDIKKYIADSNIFYMGIPFQSDYGLRYYISPDILNEITHIKKKIDGLNLLLSLEKVIVIEPSIDNIKYINKKIKSYGQFGLSKPDCSIIALGIQLNLPIMSTDYTVINMAKFLLLDTIVPGKSNFEIIKTKKFCSICKKYFDVQHMYCNHCGNKLKFKKL
jgi:endoribonuclease Nob1